MYVCRPSVRDAMLELPPTSQRVQHMGRRHRIVKLGGLVSQIF